jgi:uncharacterized protein (DUF983 family)
MRIKPHLRISDEMAMVLLLLWRAVRLRCPRCGVGKPYRGVFAMYDRCPHCNWEFEREEGYWTGAVAVNLIISELIVAAVVVPLAAMQTPLLPLFAIGLPATILLPILFYRHSKSFWMAIDFIVHPVSLW